MTNMHSPLTNPNYYLVSYAYKYENAYLFLNVLNLKFV